MRCPFAIWHPLTGPGSAYTGGPFKIVWHTTEGSTAAGAFAALRSAHADSHFVVDDKNIYQLIDTDFSSKSLRNAAGGVETNRDSAIQIELVGFAGKPKNRATLENARRLARWIEEVHGVPRVWPNGLPKPPTAAGGDPGGHNRNAQVWNLQGGHYGHSQVPENTHWDPAFTREEADFLLDANGSPTTEAPSQVRVVGIAPEKLNLRGGPNTMEDKGDIPEGTILEKKGMSPDGLWTQVLTPAGFGGWVATRFTAPA